LGYDWGNIGGLMGSLMVTTMEYDTGGKSEQQSFRISG